MKHNIPKEANNILTTLKKAGFEAYAVGGAVRDMLLGRETKDWDFTTNATPDEILKLFPEGFYDNKFGTVGVALKEVVDGEEKVLTVYEITTYRSEQGYTDHRHPDRIVWGKTIEEDLKRRDFTVNAMAYDGETLVDLFDGQKDLEHKMLRAVGDADLRFKEDALRMMRAIRFATQLQFIIEPATFDAIKQNSSLIMKISWERIHDELIRTLSSDFPADGIRLLRNAEILQKILPEFEKCFGVDQKSPQRHHIYDVGTHQLKALEFCPSKDPIVRFATLIHDIGKPVTQGRTPEDVTTFYNHEIVGASIARNLCDRLRFSKKDREKIVRLVRYHQFTVEEHQTDSAVRRFIRNVGKENIQDMLDLRTGDRLGGGAKETSWRTELFKKRIEEVQIQPFSVSDLKVSGHDVMQLFAIGPGPYVGAMLKTLFDDVVEQKIPNEREVLLKRLEDLKKENKRV